MTLTTALETFSDSLDDIKQSCVENMQDIITHTPHHFTGEVGHYLNMIAKRTDTPIKEWEQQLRKLIVEEKTEQYLRTIKRIVKIQSPKSTHGGITDADILRAKEYPIEDLIDTKMFKAGGSKWKFKTLCPFHSERTASFCVDKKNLYKCFGCQDRGSAIDYVMKTQNMNFVQSVKFLAK